jgi:hypothetical protein
MGFRISVVAAGRAAEIDATENFPAICRRRQFRRRHDGDCIVDETKNSLSPTSEPKEN